MAANHGQGDGPPQEYSGTSFKLLQKMLRWRCLAFLLVVLNVAAHPWLCARYPPRPCEGCAPGHANFSDPSPRARQLAPGWAQEVHTTPAGEVEKDAGLPPKSVPTICPNYPGPKTPLKDFACEIFTETARRMQDTAFWKNDAAPGTLLLPPVDPRAKFLYQPEVNLESGMVQLMKDMSGHVPRIIHQAFFPPKRHNLRLIGAWLERANATQEYAAQWGYTYIRWDLSSSDELERLLGSERFQLLQSEVSSEHLASAANLVRYAVLEAYGGFWIDLDYSLPSDPTTGEPVDLLDVFAPNGCTFVPEASCRNIEKSAVFVETSVFSCPAHHPILRKMIASQLQNFEKTTKIELTQRGGSFVQTGTMLFNKVLFGKYTLIDRQTVDSIMTRE